MSAYVLEPVEEEQCPEDTTFIGGFPRLPAEVELPRCGLCGAIQTFFFQVAFPSDHIWSGNSLAVFACTMCATQKHWIPPMFYTTKKPLDIPDEFFQNYQINFRFFVFQTNEGQLRYDYTPRVSFLRWHLLPVEDDYLEEENTIDEYGMFSKVGGRPIWLQFDNAPTTLSSYIPMHFLLQVEHDFEFETVTGAPPQRVIDAQTGKLILSDEPYYLFLGGAVYLFGTPEPDQRLVYVVIQN